ncbi:MAG TPA: hypothetical protein VFA99_05195 [Acidobacteriaceae bacterium]|nr:hypothetical protein [Acidobacteriaceae bacterium]
MRAVKASPLFRIALLSLAVLLAHTAHASNVRHSFPAAPPCPRKVAAAQPDAQNKLLPGIKRIANPGDRAVRHTFRDSFAFIGAPVNGFFYTHTAGPLAAARRTLYIPPQRLPFALRI